MISRTIVLYELYTAQYKRAPTRESVWKLLSINQLMSLIVWYQIKTKLVKPKDMFLFQRICR